MKFQFYSFKKIRKTLFKKKNDKHQTSAIMHLNEHPFLIFFRCKNNRVTF